MIDASLDHRIEDNAGRSRVAAARTGFDLGWTSVQQFESVYFAGLIENGLASG
jgi:hypothetical protein